MAVPKPSPLFTYKQLLGHVQQTISAELKEEAVLFYCILSGLVLAMIVIAIVCFWDEHAKEAAVQVFCTTSVLAAVTSAAYLLIKEDSIKRRNNELLSKIEKNMDDGNTRNSKTIDPNKKETETSDPRLVSHDYLKNLAEDKVTSLFEEKARIPFKP